MKKALKIFGITFLIVIALLIAIPFVFQGQIKGMVKQFINDNLNAKVEFSDVSLSFLRDFPQAHVSVTDLVITNFEPFKDETFATAKNISFSMSVKELFKNADEEPIIINTISVDEALLTLKTNTFGNNNYDLAETNESAASETDTSNFSFDLKDYNINNSALSYIDEASNILIYITELNHEGNGIFSADKSEINTVSAANVSISIDSTNYLSNNQIKLDALIGLDLENSTYTFKDNKGYINQLPIEFKGYVKLLEEGQEVDISFENPESSFKDFLAVIPEVYSKNLDNVETTGDFKINGNIKGLNSEETIPTLDINILSDNASFKYPDLPKRVEDISINTTIKNTTGNADDTFININTLNFKIDDDVFKSSATLKNITKNMVVNASIDGVLNLANISKAYPVDLETPLTGILKAKLTTAFDMDAIDTNAYERIKNSGSLNITDFKFASESLANPIEIQEAAVIFNPGLVNLNNFKAKTAESDFNATGTIKNLLGYILSDNTLKGDFNLNSNLFRVSDFLIENETESEATEPSSALKIPAFLDCVITANAKTVVYDNLELKDVKGVLIIKDQKATLQDLTSSLFDGALVIGGTISSEKDVPTFSLNLGANGFDIAKSFQSLTLLQNLAPLAKILEGTFNTSINISGNLDDSFSPVMNSISGNALAELLATKVKPNQSELINQLEGSLNFVDFNKLNLKDLKTTLNFADGKVNVQPFHLTYEDISIDISGSHGFDKTLNYNAIFNVPAKYLGSDVNRLIGKIDTQEANNISIPVTANIIGTFTSPSIKTDLSSGVSNLTKQLIEIEKQKLLNTGKDKVKNMLGNIIGENQTKADSTKAQQNNTANDVLNDIIGKSETKTDSTSAKTNTNAVIKDALGGLLGKNKKDTVN